VVSFELVNGLLLLPSNYVRHIGNCKHYLCKLYKHLFSNSRVFHVILAWMMLMKRARIFDEGTCGIFNGTIAAFGRRE
jgi:hypothetical protein